MTKHRRTHLWLIALAGVIVPRRLRADWRQEWEAELRCRELLLEEWDRLDWRSKLDLLRRSLGAFWDALLLQPQRLEDEMIQDLRFGVRMLLKHKGLTAVAVLTLALGVGATTALFSVIYGVLISPYPYARSHEIWTPGLVSVKAKQTGRAYPLTACQEMAKLPAFAEVMATSSEVLLLTGEYAPEIFGGIRMSGNAFQFLGVPPLVGRALQPSDIRANGEPEPVAVLSFKRWQLLFNGDPNAVGKTLRLNNEVYTIVGVMPPRFGWWADNGVWLPLGTVARDAEMVFPVVRLKPGVTTAVAEGQLHALHQELAKDPAVGIPKGEFTTRLTNYLDTTVAGGQMERSLQLLFGAVGLLMLIACANVANLQLAKGTARAREMSIRLALGARRVRLVRQLLTESVLLSLLGGALGLLFAYWITHLIPTLMPLSLVPNEARIEVNRQVLFFCLGISALTGILFGLLPALQSSRRNLVESLKDEGRATSSAAGGKIRSSLVVVEVALAMVLLLSASLTVRSFTALQKIELGFQPERLLGVALLLPPQRYATWEQRNRFAQDLLERVSHLPGIEAATLGTGGLPFDGPESGYTIDGQAGAETGRITLNTVGADYLRTLGIPLRQGRMLTEQEVANADPVAVINEAAAQLWPAGESPLGRRIQLHELSQPRQADSLTPPAASPYVTVVGVIGNTRSEGLRDPARPAVFVPYTKLAPSARTLAFRAQHDPRQLLNALRAQVRQLDSEQPLFRPMTFEEVLGRWTEQPRFMMALFSLFAALGLGLALAGVYSVLSYLVSLRTRELGVRMALGAQPADILRLILRTGGKLVALGMVIGVLASLAAARLVGSRLNLFQVTNTDPLSFLGVVVLLSVVAAAACFIPARRATKVDPLEALHHD